MYVHMRHRLPSLRAIVDSDVVAVRVVFTVNYLLLAMQQALHSIYLIGSQLKIRAHMTLGDDQGVAGRHGKPITNNDRKIVLINDPLLGQTAEGTRM